MYNYYRHNALNNLFTSGNCSTYTAQCLVYTMQDVGKYNTIINYSINGDFIFAYEYIYSLIIISKYYLE